MGQPLLRDGHVASDLPADDLPHVVQIHRLGKVIDVRHGEEGAVGEAALVVCLHRQVQQDLPIFLHMDDVGVVVGDSDLCRIRPFAQRDLDIEDQIAV